MRLARPKAATNGAVAATWATRALSPPGTGREPVATIWPATYSPKAVVVARKAPMDRRLMAAIRAMVEGMRAAPFRIRRGSWSRTRWRPRFPRPCLESRVATLSLLPADDGRGD